MAADRPGQHAVASGTHAPGAGLAGRWLARTARRQRGCWPSTPTTIQTYSGHSWMRCAMLSPGGSCPGAPRLSGGPGARPCRAASALWHPVHHHGRRNRALSDRGLIATRRAARGSWCSVRKVPGRACQIRAQIGVNLTSPNERSGTLARPPLRPVTAAVRLPFRSICGCR
jgi:hypothetical protein